MKFLSRTSNVSGIQRTVDSAALDLHIKHPYAMGEDQQDASYASSDNILPEIMVNEVNTRDNRGWH